MPDQKFSCKQSLIARYRQYLPVDDSTPIVSLGEGNTPLVRSFNLPHLLGAPHLQLYFKLEGLNPTGSFKDRGMTMAISKALQAGSEAVICASTGNTSASAAAFAARAGMSCFVVLPAGKVALGKLSQAVLYGARVMVIEGNFDQALQLVKQVATNNGLTIVNSINPYRLEGQKTAAFEVTEQLGEAPDYLCIPVGNAGNISAYYRGFKEGYQHKLNTVIPVMCGFQAAGAAPFVCGQPVEKPETLATAIRIGNPASWHEAIKATSESGGFFDAVTDDEILAAYKMLAAQEGIFCEPSSAASFAGLIKSLQTKRIPHTAKVVCVLTGNGLKDPDTGLAAANVDLTPIAATESALLNAMLPPSF